MTEITFGTDGWRSTVDTDFNEKNVRVVTQAISNYLYEKELAQKGCVVAYDTRTHSEGFADVVSDVLMKNGIAALRMETFCPTPQAAFAVKNVGAAGAIMLTASHNPQAYNGIKFIPQYAGPATPDITDDIEWEIGTILEDGDLEPLRALVTADRFDELAARFELARAKRDFAVDDVAAGRDFIAAYVSYFKYAEGEDHDHGHHHNAEHHDHDHGNDHGHGQHA